MFNIISYLKSVIKLFWSLAVNTGIDFHTYTIEISTEISRSTNCSFIQLQFRKIVLNLRKFSYFLVSLKLLNWNYFTWYYRTCVWKFWNMHQQNFTIWATETLYSNVWYIVFYYFCNSSIFSISENFQQFIFNIVDVLTVFNVYCTMKNIFFITKLIIMFLFRVL